MGVVSLIPNNALCMNQEDLAQRLELCANKLRNGMYGDVERIVVLFENAGPGITNRTYGRPTTAMELVGLLEYAKYGVMNGPVES